MIIEYQIKELLSINGWTVKQSIWFQTMMAPFLMYSFRTQKDGTRKQFTCPKFVKEYNMYMGGVDKADFFCAIYGNSRKSLNKWWHRIFFGLLDRTLRNAFISFMKITNAKCSSLQFRHVATGIIILGKPYITFFKILWYQNTCRELRFPPQFPRQT